MNMHRRIFTVSLGIACDVLALAGAALVVVALFMVHPALGLVALGVVLMATAILLVVACAGQDEKSTTVPVTSEPEVFAGIWVGGGDDDQRSPLERIAPMSLSERKPTAIDKAMQLLKGEFR
ncbi:MAG: hypothetical protein GEU75_06300 [Dehalococcoidia bacterium]|nr:hypothetical protein [Dehalococcoidia bacterium]